MFVQKCVGTLSTKLSNSPLFRLKMKGVGFFILESTIFQCLISAWLVHVYPRWAVVVFTSLFVSVSSSSLCPLFLSPSFSRYPYVCAVSSRYRRCFTMLLSVFFSIIYAFFNPSSIQRANVPVISFHLAGFLWYGLNAWKSMINYSQINPINTHTANTGNE